MPDAGAPSSWKNWFYFLFSDKFFDRLKKLRFDLSQGSRLFNKGLVFDDRHPLFHGRPVVPVNDPDGDSLSPFERLPECLKPVFRIVFKLGIPSADTTGRYSLC